MMLHLNSQTDLEEAIHALVKQDPRLRPVFEIAGMPALRRREPGYAGLAAIVCGQQLSTASAAAIWARLSAAFDPFHHDTLRKARADRLGRLGLSAAKIKTLKILAREIASERLNLDVLANEDLKKVAERHDTTPGAIAVAWALRHPPVDGAIVGFRRPDQVDPILPAATLELTDEDATELEADGASGGAVAADAWRRGASVVVVLQGAQEAGRRDRRTSAASVTTFGCAYPPFCAIANGIGLRPE